MLIHFQIQKSEGMDTVNVRLDSGISNLESRAQDDGGSKTAAAAAEISPRSTLPSIAHHKTASALARSLVVVPSIRRGAGTFRKKVVILLHHF